MQDTPNPSVGRGALVDLGGRIALRASLVVLGVVAVTFLAIQLAGILLVVFVALILAAGVYGPATWLEERGAPRTIAVVAVYLALAAILAGLILVVAPPVVSQLGELIRSIPDIAEGLADRVGPLLARVGVDTSRVLELVAQQLQGAAGALTGVPFLVIDAAIAVVTAVFLSVLVLLERRSAHRWLFRFLAPGDRPAADRLVGKVVHRLGAYVRGQLLVMSVTGVASYVGLLLLGIPFPVALGVLAFLTEAIPLAGPILAGAVMVAVALLESPAQAAATLVLVFAIQQLEGLVLVPQIQGRVISISPAVALIAVLAGSTLGGIGGALVAIPLMAISSVVIDDVIVPWRRGEIRAGLEANGGSGGQPGRPPPVNG